MTITFSLDQVKRLWQASLIHLRAMACLLSALFVIVTLMLAAARGAYSLADALSDGQHNTWQQILTATFVVSTLCLYRWLTKRTSRWFDDDEDGRIMWSSLPPVGWLGLGAIIAASLFFGMIDHLQGSAVTTDLF